MTTGSPTSCDNPRKQAHSCGCEAAQEVKGINKLFGSWVAGGNSLEGRKDDDFYATPNEVTEGLIFEEGCCIPNGVWEPCCGTGSMSKVLEAHGYKVNSSDLINRGFGKGGIDFLKDDSLPKVSTCVAYNAIITNPPFEISEKIIIHAFELGARYLALVLKAQYWHAARRAPLYSNILLREYTP